MKKVLQLSIGLPNSPGSLAHMSDMLRAADVNIDALFCTEVAQETAVNLIVDDAETAKMVLGKIGPVTVTEVLMMETQNKPGTIAQLARKCAGAGINIRHIYAVSSGKGAMVYLATEKLDEAAEVLK